MLPGRKYALLAIYETYKKIRIPLLSQKGAIWGSFSGSDDPGYFLYVPLLSFFLNIPILVGAQTLTLLLCSLLFSSFSLLCIYVSSSWLTSVVSILCIFPLIFKLITVCDVYIAPAAAFIPLGLFLIVINEKYKKWLYVSGFLTGIFSSALSLIRSYSALPVLVFVYIVLFFSNIFSKKRKIIALCFLILGYLIPCIHYSYALQKKNRYLNSQGIVQAKDSRHGFWHNIYIGFGFTRNPYKIIWHDICSLQAAQKVKPGIKEGNKVYEGIVKNLVFDLLKKDRHFFFTSLFARLGVVAMFFLIWFGWFGLLCSYFFPKPWYEELSFIIALGISGLPGILTIPCFEYLTGFITCTVLYTIYSFIFALNNGMIEQIRRWLFR